MPSTQRTVFRIVRQSRANNPGWGVVGALLFGDGHFLQLLEGMEESVDELSRIIFADDRHRDATVLRRGPTEAPQFAHWSMKSPTMGKDLRSVPGLGLDTRLTPGALNDKKLDALIRHLLEHEETTVSLRPEGNRSPRAARLHRAGVTGPGDGTV